MIVICIFGSDCVTLVMESCSTGAQLTRKGIFAVWRSNPPTHRVTRVCDYVKTFYKAGDAGEQENKRLKLIVKNECEKIRRKWTQKRRRLDLFIKAHQAWLDEEIDFKIIPKTKETTPGPSVGRPRKRFQDCSSKTKRRKVSDLVNTYEKEELTFAAAISVRASGKRDGANIMQEISCSSPKRATTYKKAKQRTLATPEYRPYTPEEGLAFLLANKLTVNQYKNMQQEASERGFHLYPSYDRILKEKKLCYPPEETITVTDISAAVQLQSLLNHTATRLCTKVLDDYFSRPDATNESYTLIYKWGCDGSSGHSIYKQKFDSDDSTDEYMFIISMVPIRLIADSNEHIIWQNPRPSSPRFCRVIKFIHKKETNDLIQEECDLINTQIDSLSPTVINLNDETITVQHNLIMTIVDGKVCNILSDTKSTQKCFICKATPKEMNSVSIIRDPDPSMYQFGISSLHAYIRTMECVLNIASRLKIKQWQVRGKENKAIVDGTKQEIKRKFKERGLIIDKVKPGFGTSNDGNTARRFFNNYKDTANITGLDEQLLYKLSVILKCLASGYEIHTENFGSYVKETKLLYIENYAWYHMPATLHKILTHGTEIIKSCVIPIGQMSEEASEAKNKDIRKIREGHTLKISRERTNLDIFRYLLVSSDPHISLLRKLPKKEKHSYGEDFLKLIKH